MSVSFQALLKRAARTELLVRNAVGLAACAGIGSYIHTRSCVLLRDNKEGKNRNIHLHLAVSVFSLQATA